MKPITHTSNTSNTAHAKITPTVIFTARDDVDTPPSITPYVISVAPFLTNHNEITRAKNNEIARIKHDAHARAVEWAEIFKHGDPQEEAEYERLLTEEGLEKFNAMPEKLSLRDFVPSWMTATRWTTGERRKAAKLNAYGINRVAWYETLAQQNKPREEYSA